MKILVFGGTGLIGSRVVAHLLKEVAHLGVEEIILATRRPPQDISLNQWGWPSAALPRIRWLEWDLMRAAPDEFYGMLHGVTHLFLGAQFPGHPVESPARGLTYQRVDVEATTAILQLFSRSKQSLRVIYVSGAGAGQGRQEPWFVAKDAAEALIAQFVHDVGGSMLALRPSIVVGAQDRSVNLFARMARRFGVIPLLGDGNTQVYPIFVEDLAAAFVSLGFASALNGAFDFPGPERMSFRALLEARCHANANHPLFVKIPLGLAGIAARMAEWLPGQLFSRNALRFLTMDVAFNRDKVHEILLELQVALTQCRPMREVFKLYN